MEIEKNILLSSKYDVVAMKVFEIARGRKIVLYGDEPLMREALEKINVPVEFVVTGIREVVTQSVKFLYDLKGKRDEYFIIVPNLNRNQATIGRLMRLGYKEDEDFLICNGHSTLVYEPTCRADPPLKIAITAILKNEGSYVKEWIDYHLLAGISKFYLYDNNSTDDMKDVLLPYIDKGIVEYNFFPGKYMQNVAYRDAIERHRFDCQYMAFIDGDEFLLPVSGGQIWDVIDSIAALNHKFGGVHVHWRVFGSSQYDKKPDGGVLKNFIYRAKDDFSANAHVKSIVNPRCVMWCNNPHYCYYFYDRYQVDEYGKEATTPWPVEDRSFDKICINHYFTKSKEEWQKRRSLGKADVAGKRNMEEFKKFDRNEVYDDSIVKYLEKATTRSDVGRMPIREYDMMDRLRKICIYSEFGKEAIVFNMETLLCEWYCFRIENEKSWQDDAYEKAETLFVEAICSLLKIKFCQPWEVQLLMRSHYLLLRYPFEHYSRLLNGLQKYIYNLNKDVSKRNIAGELLRELDLVAQMNMSALLMKDRQPFLSVIIPTVISQNNIMKFIKHLDEQTFRNFELLIVNDEEKHIGGNREIVVGHHIVRCYSNSFEKSRSNLNNYQLGVHVSCGKYILFSDGKDCFPHDAFERLYRMSENKDMDMILVMDAGDNNKHASSPAHIGEEKEFYRKKKAYSKKFLQRYNITFADLEEEESFMVEQCW